MSELQLSSTPIPGLFVVDLPVHGDNRGWFKENWQRRKMVAAGLPDFGPVQNNVSFNAKAGVTRGFHAEPWDKLVSVTTGSVFGAWVDLRAGKTFGATYSVEIGPDRAVFVPSGVGNAFQTLEPGTAYSYLVNDHWSADAKESYAFVNLADETLAVAWPIPLEQAELSAADREHPRLAGARPAREKTVMILGANGQVGRALRQRFPDAPALGRDQLDLTDPKAWTDINWGGVDTVINAAAYTAVDSAETPTGRRLAWEINVAGVGRLVDAARAHRLRVVHLSSDYVFDGTEELHREDEPFSPLGVYGQTKAAGDALVATVANHYILRTSWVVGDGNNFVKTMASLAGRGVSPSVIDDQYGRLTFAADLARAIETLLDRSASPGTYNVSCRGPVTTWAALARAVFEAQGRDPGDVTSVTSEEYARGKTLAPRPRHSALDLSKIEAAGFLAPDTDTALRAYLDQLAGA